MWVPLWLICRTRLVQKHSEEDDLDWDTQRQRERQLVVLSLGFSPSLWRVGLQVGKDQNLLEDQSGYGLSLGGGGSGDGLTHPDPVVSGSAEAWRQSSSIKAHTWATHTHTAGAGVFRWCSSGGRCDPGCVGGEIRTWITSSRIQMKSGWDNIPAELPRGPLQVPKGTEPNIRP